MFEREREREKERERENLFVCFLEKEKRRPLEPDEEE